MPRSSNFRPVTILKSILIALYAFGVLFTSTDACDGYKVKVNKIETCDSSNQIKLTNPKVELTKDCELFVQGCAELTSGFTSCKVMYDVKKRGMIVPFKGEKDVCDEVPKVAKEKKASELFAKYKVPSNCPFKAIKACSAKGETFDIQSYKDKFRLAAGQYSGTITVQSNTGKSCFKFDVELKRGK